MKKFLTNPRSILGATLWGAIVAIIVFFGLMIADFLFATFRSNFGPAAQINTIAVGGGYSISLDATPAHPFLAEYDQSISIYRSDPWNKEPLGRLEIPTNYGGSVRIGVLVSTEKVKAEVVLADRYATTRIDLTTQKGEELKSWKQPDLKPIGIISGESYPISFIPCSVWEQLPIKEQELIINSEDKLDKLKGFCDVAQSHIQPDR